MFPRLTVTKAEMSLFPHNEAKYYSFGLRAGIANLLHNGLRLGLKKTAGKITQPINSYTRFPEYYWFELTISEYLVKFPEERRASILDVGSPKTLGLYLGTKTASELVLTDISKINVDEYKVMWQALSGRARGHVSFLLQDARSLQFPDSQFDVVYSMSVLEHIEGETGDSSAIRELLRVLKPGGLLLLSIPFGGKYVEQKRVGFSGAAKKTGDQNVYFFQRVYDSAALQDRLLAHLGQLQDLKSITVQRRRSWLGRAFGALGENIRGVMGGINPLLSVLINRSRPGIDSAFATDYAEFHKAQDVYGDIIVSGVKR